MKVLYAKSRRMVRLLNMAKEPRSRSMKRTVAETTPCTYQIPFHFPLPGTVKPCLAAFPAGRVGPKD